MKHSLPIINTLAVRHPNGELVHTPFAEVMTLPKDGTYVVTNLRKGAYDLVVKDVAPGDFYQIHGNPASKKSQAVADAYARVKAQQEDRVYFESLGRSAREAAAHRDVLEMLLKLRRYSRP